MQICRKKTTPHDKPMNTAVSRALLKLTLICMYIV